MAKRNVTVVDPETKEARKRELQAQREARFWKHAERRVRAALGRIKLVERLGNRKSFGYTNDQAITILTALTNAVARVQAAFEESNNEVDQFTL